MKNITTSLLMIHLKCTVVHYANLNSTSINKPLLNYKPLNIFLISFFLSFFSFFFFFWFLIYVHFNKAFLKTFYWKAFLIIFIHFKIIFNKFSSFPQFISRCSKKKEIWNWSPCLIFCMIVEKKLSGYILLTNQISLSECLYLARYWAKCIF